MDYASKGSLRSIIEQSKGVDEKLAFRNFIQVASAVKFLHENGLVHRNIKLENILLDETNNLKLCDFGWCGELNLKNRLTFSSNDEYIPHEIIKKTRYNQSIDIWSMGILLFELIQGHSPFKVNINL